MPYSNSVFQVVVEDPPPPRTKWRGGGVGKGGGDVSTLPRLKENGNQEKLRLLLKRGRGGTISNSLKQNSKQK